MDFPPLLTQPEEGTTMDNAYDDNKKRKKEDKCIYSMLLKSMEANTDQNRVSCSKHLQTSEETSQLSSSAAPGYLSEAAPSHTMGMAVAGEWPLWH